ncbi:glutamate racemase [Candidatus Roizmanbacteria bacterium]|nr:glutamate racemase [Candidatus Roizmanbacteria bacterium]
MSRIGIFDSGLGGLVILNDVLNELPEYDYIYLGDNAHVPYGSRNINDIYDLTLQGIQALISKDCSLIILACNTATAAALRRIQQTYLPHLEPEIKVLGVIRPASEVILEEGYRSVGVLATEATVRSESFIRELNHIGFHGPIHQIAAPLLVPFIESGNWNSGELESFLHSYLEPFNNGVVDSLILGCTHYGLFTSRIQQLVGSGIHVIAEGKYVSQKLATYLKRHPEVEHQLSKNRSRDYFVTGEPTSYQHFARIILTDHFLPHSQIFPLSETA